MNICEFSDIIGVDLIIRRYANQKNRHTASFERTETKSSKESSILTGKYGNSNIDAAHAVIDYIEKIKGMWLVVNAMSEDSRKEFGVPDTLMNY